MIQLKAVFESCADALSAHDVLQAIEAHETSAATRLEAQRQFRCFLVQRSNARVLEAAALKADRHLNGALNKLATEAGVPLEQVKSLTFNT